MALPLSRALNGTWNVDGSRGESSRKIQSFISRLSLLSPDDKSKVWREWIEIHFEFSQFVNLKKWFLPKASRHSHFLKGAICVWSRGADFRRRISRKVDTFGRWRLKKCTSPVSRPREQRLSFFTLLNFFVGAAALVALWKKEYHFQALIKFFFEIRFKFFSSNLEFS